MSIVNKENSRSIVANVLHPVLYVRGARGEMTVATEQPEKHLFFKLLNLTAEDFGDPEFKKTYGLCYAVCGGDLSADGVVAMGRTGGLGVCGSGGEIGEMKKALGEKPFLVRMSADADLEVAQRLIDQGVVGVEADDFEAPTEALVWFRVRGIREEEGKILVPHKVIARASGTEQAERFVSPPDQRLVESLLQAGRITEQEARLASKIPVADDITADPDGQPLTAVIPAFSELCSRKQAEHGYQQRVRVGAAGVTTGLDCLCAFELGVAYVVTDPAVRDGRPILKDCAYRYMKNLLIRMGAAPERLL